MLNDTPFVAVLAANALIKIWPQGMDEIVSFLVEKLKYDDSFVLMFAAEGIGSLGPKAVSLVQNLKPLLNNDDANWEAAIAILKITGGASDAQEVARLRCESGDWVKRMAGEVLLEEIARIVAESG
jgi:HEAT repeat protein